MASNDEHKIQDIQPTQSAEETAARKLAEIDEKKVNTPETLEDIVAGKESPDSPGLMTPDLAEVAGLDKEARENPETDGGKATPADEATQAEIKKRSKFSKFALISLILTLLAWLTLMLPWSNGGFVALVIAVVSVVTSILGLRSPRRGWRDIATTSLIASTVLAVIVLAFIIVLYIVL